MDLTRSDGFSPISKGDQQMFSRFPIKNQLMSMQSHIKLGNTFVDNKVIRYNSYISSFKIFLILE